MRISKVLDILSSGDHVDVHNFEKPFKTDGEGRLIYAPERLSSSQAVELFSQRSNSGGPPCNLLNLGCLKDNATPACFSNRNDYSLMHTCINNGKSEKREWHGHDCSAFQLLASKGAAHLLHVDRHGVYTTALTEEEKQLWLIWPGLTLEDLQSMHVHDGGIAVLVDQGDMLIQPPNMLHALL
ncbi:Ff.00g065060.m01.CDS01 [Fusarium sp. VM40]|nr:Ff.00g065060.m01.CDS01 [Fusarium sp. VM40]